MGLGIITFSEMREWVHLRWAGHVVGMGMRDTPNGLAGYNTW